MVNGKSKKLSATAKRSRKKEVKIKHRDIGIDVNPPKRMCEDPNCPFHGTLPVRGQMFRGTVEKTKMDGTVVVKIERLHYVKKYERYERKYKKFSVHAPPCMDVETDKEVRIMECRPLSKTVSFVVVEVME